MKFWELIKKHKAQTAIFMAFVISIVAGFLCCFQPKEVIECDFLFCNKVKYAFWKSLFAGNFNFIQQHFIAYLTFIATGMTGIAIFKQFKSQEELSKENIEENILSNSIKTLDNCKQYELIKFFITKDDNYNISKVTDFYIDINNNKLKVKIDTFGYYCGLKLLNNGIFLPLDNLKDFQDANVQKFTTQDIVGYYKFFIDNICSYIEFVILLNKITSKVKSNNMRLANLSSYIKTLDVYKVSYIHLSEIYNKISKDKDTIFLNIKDCLEKIGLSVDEISIDTQKDIQNNIDKIKNWEGFRDEQTFKKYLLKN